MPWLPSPFCLPSHPPFPLLPIRPATAPVGSEPLTFSEHPLSPRRCPPSGTIPLPLHRRQTPPGRPAPFPPNRTPAVPPPALLLSTLSLGLSIPPPCFSPSQPRFLRPPNYHLSHVLFREAAQSHKICLHTRPKTPSPGPSHQLSPSSSRSHSVSCKLSTTPKLVPASSTPAFAPPPATNPYPRPSTRQPADASFEIKHSTRGRPALTWALAAARRRSRPGSPPGSQPAALRALRPTAPAAPPRAPASGFRRGGSGGVTPGRQGGGETRIPAHHFRPGPVTAPCRCWAKPSVRGGQRDARAGGALSAHSHALHGPRPPLL